MSRYDRRIERLAKALVGAVPGRLCPGCLVQASGVGMREMCELIETGVFGLRADSCALCDDCDLTVGLGGADAEAA